jgi:hypothetical protein
MRKRASFFGTLLLVAFIGQHGVLALPSNDSMAGYWKLDESSAGSTVIDSSGDGDNGTPLGSGGANNLPQPSASVPGVMQFPDSHSLNFDGTDDLVDLGLSSNLHVTGALTIAAWVKFNSNYTSVQTILANTSITGSGGNYLLEFGRAAN